MRKFLWGEDRLRYSDVFKPLWQFSVSILFQTWVSTCLPSALRASLTLCRITTPTVHLCENRLWFILCPSHERFWCCFSSCWIVDVLKYFVPLKTKSEESGYEKGQRAHKGYSVKSCRMSHHDCWDVCN